MNWRKATLIVIALIACDVGEDAWFDHHPLPAPHAHQYRKMIDPIMSQPATER